MDSTIKFIDINGHQSEASVDGVWKGPFSTHDPEWIINGKGIGEWLTCTGTDDNHYVIKLHATQENDVTFRFYWTWKKVYAGGLGDESGDIADIRIKSWDGCQSIVALANHGGFIDGGTHYPVVFKSTPIRCR